LEIIFDLPFGFPINNIISLSYDSEDLLGVAPGHYHLQATPTAELLCAQMQTSLHSQFSDQQGRIEPREHVAGLDAETRHLTKIGVACFEPGTALLLQNPLNHDTYDPDQALSRPIGQMKFRDTVLAERLGSRGQDNVFYLARVTCVMSFGILQDDNPAFNKSIQEDTLSTGFGVTLTKHHHIRAYGRLRQDSTEKWHLTHQPKNPVWMEAADLGRGTSPSRRTCKKPVKKVVNLVLDPPGNVVILTPDLYLYTSASLGYHMRHGKHEDGGQETGSGTPVYTLKESAALQGLPEFSQGNIQWGPGAVTRTLGGRLVFKKNKAIRQGRNLFHNQPIEILSNVIETLQTTEDNMRLLQGWKRVCRGWRHHISTYTDPDNQWQRNLRMEVREIWKSLYDRSMPIAQKDEKHPHLEPRKVTSEFTTALCTILEEFSLSRALVGGVASMISVLARTNDHLLKTLGPNAAREANPFPLERIALQSHLTASLLRHGLAQTPWHSNRTGPWGIAPKILEETHADILPRLLKQGNIELAQERTEAHRRGYEILQILQALLAIGNPTKNDTELHHLSAHELWDLQQLHRTLISHLYVLLPILTLTGHQQPYRNRMGRVGRTLLIHLLTLCNSLESTLPDSLHAQYFGCLWKISVPGREMNAP